MQLIIFLPFVIIAGIALWRSGVWERRTIGEELATEGVPVVRPEELEAIKRDGIFRTRRITGLNRKHSAALVRALHELSFRKRRVRIEGRDPEVDPLVARWRANLVRLREEV